MIDLDMVHKLVALTAMPPTNLLVDGRAPATHYGGPFTIISGSPTFSVDPPSACVCCGGLVEAYQHNVPSSWKHTEDCEAYAQEKAFQTAREFLRVAAPALRAHLIEALAEIERMRSAIDSVVHMIDHAP